LRIPGKKRERLNKMKLQELANAVKMAEKVNYLFVATAGEWPHLGIAGKIDLISEERVAVTGWFCPGTMANLQSNPRIALVVWDVSADTGYQLLGELEEIKELAQLDGYSPGIEKNHLPLSRTQLVIHIHRIMEFKRAPHSDAEK
jgi:hypothetical protein